MMKIIYNAILVTSFLFLVIVHCADTDLEVKKDSNSGLGRKIPLTTNQNDSSDKKTGGLDSNVKGKPQVGDSKGTQNADLDEKNPSKELGSKEAANVKTDANNSQLGKDVDQKKNGSGSKDVPKEELLSSTKKETGRGEECDSSFKCTIENEKHAMVACLRVPGNEEFSLLIQNKGEGPLSVDIVAPDFVGLERKNVQLQEKENEKVKVSVGDGKTDKFIYLKTGGVNCSLDFLDFIAHNPMKKSNSTSQLTLVNLFRRRPFLGFIFLAAMLVIASIVMYVTFQRRRFRSNGSNSKYQKLDMELPVSGGARKESDPKGGWDDNWSDGWDDVEAAPTTPSMPLTPSLSSKGIASIRVSKEGWKD